jgi:glycerol-3-phosphate cytidylyltransferase
MQDARVAHRPVVGYTTGVYDLLHVGHLNILRNAKAMCDRLIVGVTDDELVQYKHKTAIIPYVERLELVRALRFVDSVVGQHDMDKFAAWQRLKFDVMFVGDDWYGSEKWSAIETKFHRVGVRVVYFPYTRGISSTRVNTILDRERDELLNADRVPKDLIQRLATETSGNARLSPIVQELQSHLSSIPVSPNAQ